MTYMSQCMYRCFSSVTPSSLQVILQQAGAAGAAGAAGDRAKASRLLAEVQALSVAYGVEAWEVTMAYVSALLASCGSITQEVGGG